MNSIAIRPQDHVVINGIYIGQNYKNNKYVIQLVQPDVIYKPNATFQYIEVDPEYIKHIPKKNVQDVMIIPSLTDNVSITEKKINENADLSLATIQEEWNNIIDENDAGSMEIDAAEKCDSWTLNDCDSCKRILFCLTYYKLWIVHKQKHRNKKDTHENKFYFQHLMDFIQSLKYYSSILMLNDFHHIKQFHINSNNQHNHSINNEDKQDIFEYFKREMGICSATNCRSYTRNHRDRTDCTQSDKLRRNLYFIDESKLINSQSDEISETNMQQLFDMIHCTLLHPQSSTTGSGGSSKFVTEIKESKEEKQDTNDIQTAVLSSYGFGAQFKYHEQRHKNYIKSKWKNLKVEVLNNGLYKISEFDFESIFVKAKHYLISYKGRGLIARKKSNLNNICNIKPNTKISTGHLTSLMLYTNMDDLQREFKKGCRFLVSDKKELTPVKKRNREIANWCRLLWEAITFYGESISKKQVFYHGLNCKLLFDSVIAAFNCPTSTTVNKSVAFNFSTEYGIIVQLSKFASLDSHYLDVSDLSDYPNEQERLFFQAQLGFEDIIYNNTSNKYFIKCLSLFQNITKGNFFTHNTKIFKKKHQKTLIKMMDSLVKKKENKKIPTYMQQLFEHYCSCIKQFGNIIWINKQEFAKLHESIGKYLDDNSKGNFMDWLQKTYKIKIKYPKTISYIVENSENKTDLDLFWEGKSVILPSISHTVKFDRNHKEKITLKFKLKKGATLNDDLSILLCKISNKQLPKYIQKLKCDIGIFCPEINFSFTTAITVSKELQGIPLCESVKLEGLDAFEWNIFIKFRGRVDSKNLVHKL